MLKKKTDKYFFAYDHKNNNWFAIDHTDKNYRFYGRLLRKNELFKEFLDRLRETHNISG